MDPDVFNMGLCILAPNALERSQENNWKALLVPGIQCMSLTIFLHIYYLLLHRYFFILIPSWKLHRDCLYLHVVERTRLSLMQLNYPSLLIHGQDTSTTPYVAGG
jgi:hypothetical protein